MRKEPDNIPCADAVGDFAEFYARWIKTHPWSRDLVPTLARRPPEGEDR